MYRTTAKQPKKILSKTKNKLLGRSILSKPFKYKFYYIAMKKLLKQVNKNINASDAGIKNIYHLWEPDIRLENFLDICHALIMESISKSKFSEQNKRLFHLFRIKNKFKAKSQFQPSNITLGLQNALGFIFGFLNIIPEVFKKTFNRDISSDEFKKLFKSTKQLVKEFAKLHIVAMNIIKDSTTVPSIDHNGRPALGKYFHRFIDELFTIVPNKSSEHCLVPNQKFYDRALSMENIRLFKEKLNVISKASNTGNKSEMMNLTCPALFEFKYLNANGEEVRTTLIDKLYEWIDKIFEKSLYKEFVNPFEEK